MKEKTFYSHIAGLRTLAILLVIWFHFSSNNTSLKLIPELPYGFYGVDIFLVIMGYFLIKGFTKPETIEASSFIKGKGARLLPPLIVTVLVTMLTGVFIFDAADNTSMGKVGLATLYGWSNEELKSLTTGYFADDASMNPFLHTWYMAVTMQLMLIFYIGYRLLKPLKKTFNLIILSAIGVTILIYSQQAYLVEILNRLGCTITGAAPPSYYSSIPRIWELLAGGSILLLPECRNKWITNILSLLGLILILVPALMPEACAISTPILVVIGTMIVVKYAGESIIGKLLGCRAMVWGGAISYSVYLVHMPLFVLYKGWIFGLPGDAACIILTVFSLAFGYLLWFFVEKRKFSWPLLGLLWAVTFGICLSCVRTDGFKEIINAKSNTFTLPYHHTFKWKHVKTQDISNGLNRKILEPSFLSRAKIFSNYAPLKHVGEPNILPSFVIIGDSHVYQTGIGIDAICREINTSGILLDSIIIPFWDRNVNNTGTPFYTYNKEKAWALLAWLKEHPELKTVVIAQNWERFTWVKQDWNNKPITDNTVAFLTFLRKLKEIDKNIILLEPTPTYKSAKTLHYMRWLMRRAKPLESQSDDFICTTSQHQKRFSLALSALNQAEKQGLAHVIKTADYFFSSGSCPNIHNGEVICADQHHMTIPAAIKMMKYAKNQILPLLKKTE